MNYKELVLSVYPNAHIVYFEGTKYLDLISSFENPICISWYYIPAMNYSIEELKNMIWQHGWVYLEQSIIKKLES